MTAFESSPLFLVLAALGGIVLGAVFAWLGLRGRATALQAARDADAAAAAERTHALEQRLAAAQSELADARTRLLAVVGERATLSGRLERLGQVEADLAAVRAEAQRLRDTAQAAEQRAGIATTRLTEQQQAAGEREALLLRAREEFGDRFRTLANEVLEEKSRKFTEQNQQQIGGLINPLREQLGDFRKRVDDVYDKESKDRVQLKAEIDALKHLNQRISDDATSLARALKGESRTQGAWGELVLERLLEAAGLEQGRVYERQAVLRDADGGRPRPDVIVHLPEGRDIIVDAKVSLKAYELYCATGDERERQAHLAAHLASLRTHVKELGERRYNDLPGVHSLDFVLMFVPIEAAYIEAVHHDDTLHAFALERQVVIVTSSTLLATLQTVKSLWRYDDRNRNVIEIAERAGRLYDKFVGFIADLEEAGQRVESARAALAQATGKLSTGRGNLVGQVEKLRELGAKASKALAPELVERAQVDEIQPRLHMPSNDPSADGVA